MFGSDGLVWMVVFAAPIPVQSVVNAAVSDDVLVMVVADPAQSRNVSGAVILGAAMT